ncbi:toll/interleukin-1 receptor domain-containing protein [Cellulomonas flavigena]|uniref:toll/interleukin-1 receptor domain-containing protein n=1 Tax=Cellulomonas flavigena TaxID=1711 RepID=UPI0006601E3D|nr:toll/interleukin-1 receptor domain-containing protein [Cellulomonas flavigena]
MKDLTVFISYRDAEDGVGVQEAEALREELLCFGVVARMARHDISPMADLPHTVMELIRSSSALVCLASEGFSSSPWCQQEVGFALGRDIPVFWAKLCTTETPAGLLTGQLAHQPSTGKPTIQAVTDWLAQQSAVRTELVASLGHGLSTSRCYRDSREIARLLRKIGTLTQDEWDLIRFRASTNNQVSDAVVGDVSLLEHLEGSLRIVQELP